MGIVRYLPYLRRGFKAQKLPIGQQPPSDAQHLLIDANSIIYTTVEKLVPTYDPKQVIPTSGLPKAENIYQGVLDEILRINAFVHPLVSIGIFFDGPPPVGKMYEQRRRRFLTATRIAAYFDTNLITPGTQFMQNLDAFLRKRLPRAAALPATIYYSNSLVAGEGEHKLFELLHAGKIPATDKTVIYGADSDLCMLCALSPANLFLYRETLRHVNSVHHPTQLYFPISDQTRSMGYQVEVFSSLDIRKFLHICLGTSKDPKSVHLLSYVLFSTLIGDDFLPILPELADTSVAMDLLFDTYRRTGSTPLYAENGAMDPYAVYQYFDTLMKTINNPETSPLVQLRRQYGGIYSFYDRGYASFRRAWYTNALAPRILNNGKQLGNRMNANEIFHMCKSYISCMLWVGRYYRGGLRCVNVNLYYPYLFAPTCVDLWGFLHMLIQPNIREEFKLLNPAPYRIQSYNPYDQLLMVLPKQSSYILKEVRGYNKILGPNSLFRFLFPSQILVQRDVTGTSLGESGYIRHHVFIPPPQLPMLREYMQSWNIHAPADLMLQNAVYWEREDNADYLALPPAWRMLKVKPTAVGLPKVKIAASIDTFKQEKKLQRERVNQQMSKLVAGYRQEPTNVRKSPIVWSSETISLFGNA